MIQVVVAYDIAYNKRRNKIAKCLEGYGIRVNYSVFECVLKPGSLNFNFNKVNLFKNQFSI